MVVGQNVMVKYLVILLLLSSCATVEVLDGLCYNDKKGSPICEKETAWEQCEPWLYHDGEVWSNCMMMS